MRKKLPICRQTRAADLSSPIKPYYGKDGILIYHGDCRAVLPGLRTKAGLLVSDPPYRCKARPISSGARRNRLHPLIAETVANDVPEFPIEECFKLALALLPKERHLYVFGPDILEGLEVRGKTQLVWDKRTCGCGNCELPWGHSHELLWFAVNGGQSARYPEKNGCGAARMRRSSVLNYSHRLGTGLRYHPTQKPVALLRELIESSSRVGEVVLDPFLGSGSTLVAAKLEGRKGIGIELDERYCEIAAKRLDATTAGWEAAIDAG